MGLHGEHIAHRLYRAHKPFDAAFLRVLRVILSSINRCSVKHCLKGLEQVTPVRFLVSVASTGDDEVRARPESEYRERSCGLKEKLPAKSVLVVMSCRRTTFFDINLTYPYLPKLHQGFIVCLSI